MNIKNLNPNLISSIEKAGNTITFQPNQTIYYQEEDSNSFYFIKKGRVRVFLLNKQGKDMTIEILEEGRVFGESSFFSHSHRLTSVEAITETELIVCDFNMLYPLFEKYPELMKEMLELLSKTVRNLSRQVRRLTLMSAEERIADFLLEATDHPHPSLGISADCLPYTHEEIAECTNLQRVTVTRLLKNIEKQGFISLQYGKVILINKAGLKKITEKSI